MAALTWDATGERLYETGCSHGVLFVQNDEGTGWANGVAWNGLISVTESPSGADPNALYADDIKYLELRSAEEFGATIEAYTYPDEFAACDGIRELEGVQNYGLGVFVGQQTRKPFCLCYQTLIGNDTEGTDHGYKINIIYNATVSPSEKSHSTVNESPEAVTMSWEVTTIPIGLNPADFPTLKPTAYMSIDSTKVNSTKLETIKTRLYGGNNTESTLLTPDDVYSIIIND